MNISSQGLGSCKLIPPAFLVQCCKRQQNPNIILYFVFSCFVFCVFCLIHLFDTVSQVIGYEHRLHHYVRLDTKLCSVNQSAMAGL